MITRVSLVTLHCSVTWSRWAKVMSFFLSLWGRLMSQLTLMLGSDPSFFAEIVVSGGHRISLEMLQDGRVDAVVVDSVVKW